MSELLEVEHLRKHYAIRRGPLRRRYAVVRAVDGVSLSVRQGECLALVGESGCGKTTLGACMIRLLEPTSGTVRFSGENLMNLTPSELRHRRRRFQMVLQDFRRALDPRMTVGRSLAEPLRVHSLVPPSQIDQRVDELLEQVGLWAKAAHRLPHELSGGQGQRVVIARALATEPDLLIADEPVTALDVSVRAQIINLLKELQESLDLTLVVIAHDLTMVERIAHRVAVLYLGLVVEEAPRDRLFAAALHPYTVSLLSAVPVPDPERRRSRILLEGDAPSVATRPSGCRFHTRCPIVRPRCASEAPPLVELAPGHRVACFYPGELDHESFGTGSRAAVTF